MKKLSGFLSLTIVLAGFTYLTSCNNSSSSASNFEGVVNYEIQTGPGIPPEYAEMFKSVEIKTFVKGDLSREEEKSATNTSITLGNSKTPDDPTMLIAMLGHKYAIKLNDSLKKIAANNVPKIEYIDSASATKQIAGYTCKKAKITSNSPSGESETSYVYYTTDLPYIDPKNQFKGLKGMLMQYPINLGNNMSITVSAKLVEKKTLADSLFTVPASYKQMSIADMEKEMKELMSHMAGSGADSSAGAGNGGTK